MAEAELDIGQLTAEQQEVLQQYTAVTDQNIAEAIPLLQRSQWNVQVGLPVTRPIDSTDLVL
jgi:FAS-associated factor 2